ncbi:MAG: hypothetical protein GVY18_13700 [Bacteroidetes bacterium]|jgi:hypothetical protein|nr:hypothetical protein [Bacteroidota bacterium]
MQHLIRPLWIAGYVAVAALVLTVCAAPAYAAASTDQATLDALSEALRQPISWQVLAGAVGAIVLWVVRHWKKLAAIDTRKEYLALASAVAGPSFAAIASGSSWQVVLVGAVGAVMAFAHMNSEPVRTPKGKGDRS